MSITLTIIYRYLILFSSHAFSILAPIIVYPILISRIGEVVFGKVLIIQTLISFHLIFVEYDFNLWGSRELAIGSKVDDVADKVINSKIITAIIASISYLIIGSFLAQINDWRILASGLVVILAYALNPIWFFQGREKIWSMATVNILSKFSFLLGSAYFITGPERAWQYNLHFGLGLIVLGLIVFHKHLNLSTTQINLKRGFHVFTSQLSILTYSSSSTIWIALFMPLTAVSEYAVIERLVVGARGVLGLYSQIIYPSICKEMNSDTIKQHIRFNYFFILLIFVGGCILIPFSDEITLFFLKKLNNEVSAILKVIFILPTIIAANIFPYQWLLSRSKYRETRRIIIRGAVLGLMLFPANVYAFGLWGAALASCIVEIFITLNMYSTYLHHREKHV